MAEDTKTRGGVGCRPLLPVETGRFLLLQTSVSDVGRIVLAKAGLVAFHFGSETILVGYVVNHSLATVVDLQLVTSLHPSVSVARFAATDGAAHLARRPHRASIAELEGSGRLWVLSSGLAVNSGLKSVKTKDQRAYSPVGPG